MVRICFLFSISKSIIYNIKHHIRFDKFDAQGKAKGNTTITQAKYTLKYVGSRCLNLTHILYMHQINNTTSLLSGEILPQRKLLRTITLWNISSDVGLIKYIFDVASFEEDLANRI